MADPKIEDRSDDMEHDLHKLEDHIADAEKKFEARKGDTDAASPADASAENRSAEDVPAEDDRKTDADAEDVPAED